MNESLLKPSLHKSKAKETARFVSVVKRTVLELADDIDKSAITQTFDLDKAASVAMSMVVKLEDDKGNGSAFTLTSTKGRKAITIATITSKLARFYYNGEILDDDFFPNGSDVTLESQESKVMEFDEDLMMGSGAKIKDYYGFKGFVSGKNGGKSLLARVLSAHSLDARGLDEKSLSVGWMGEAESPKSGPESENLMSLFFGIVSGAKVLVIDSFRESLNNMSGSLRTGGLSRRLPGVMTQFQRICDYYEVICYGIFNPSSKKEDVIEGIYDDLTSSVSMSMILTRAKKKGDNSGLKVTMRVSDRYFNRDDYTVDAFLPFTSMTKIEISALDRVMSQTSGILSNEVLRTL
jgi:hypothetical protein